MRAATLPGIANLPRIAAITLHTVAPAKVLAIAILTDAALATATTSLGRARRWRRRGRAIGPAALVLRDAPALAEPLVGAARAARVDADLPTGTFVIAAAGRSRNAATAAPALSGRTLGAPALDTGVATAICVGAAAGAPRLATHLAGRTSLLPLLFAIAPPALASFALGVRVGRAGQDSRQQARRGGQYGAP